MKRQMARSDQRSSPLSAPEPSHRPYLALVALAIMVALWGYNWVVQKAALQFTDVSTFAALRSSLAAVCLFAVIAVMRRPLKPANIWLTALMGILSTGGAMGLAIWALRLGAAGKTSVLVYTMPIWVLLLSVVFLGERLRGLQWIAVALALAGLCFVLSPWNMGGSTSSNLLAIAAGMCWGASTIVAKVLSAHRKVDLLSLNAWQMLFGAIPLLIILLATSHAATHWTGTFIAALVYNVVFANVVATALWLYALRVLPAGTVGLATLAVPVIGVLSAWVQLGERPNGSEAAGMFLIIVALAVLTARQMLSSQAEVRPKVNHAGKGSITPIDLE